MFNKIMTLMLFTFFCFTPLQAQNIFHAVKEGDMSLIKKLLNSRPGLVDLKNNNSETPLLTASFNCNKYSYNITRLLISRSANIHLKNKDSQTPLHGFAAAGCIKSVELLLSEGADADVRDCYKFTPLISAAQNGRTETARLLISKGVDINAGDCFDMTALHHSIRSGHPQTARLLIKKGADVNVKDNRGSTPLIFAVKGEYYDIAEQLVLSGAGVNVKNSHKLTPFGYAGISGNKNIFNLLKKNGAKGDHSLLDRTEEFIDTGDRKLHCRIYKNGTPPVILVSGFRAEQDYWNSILPGIGSNTTVVTYDRAGYGKSESGNISPDGIQTAKELYILLTKLQIPGPYILAGHSYGGKIVRLFGSMFPDKTGGLVLIDSSHESMRKTIGRTDINDYKNIPGGPDGELRVMDLTFMQLSKCRLLPYIPLTVITAGNMSADRIKNQKKHLDNIVSGSQIVIEGAGHNVHLEKPQAVVEAINKMVNNVRSKNSKRN